MTQPAACPGLIVLGMHRSGTSAVTRAANLLGAQLGDPSDLYLAHDNPDGHWESSKLIRCNDQILNAFGGLWAAPPFFPDGWERSRRADSFVPQLRRAFGQVYRDAGVPWLWKDPRICLTLPLWRRVLGDFSVLLVLREPLSVARSLERRDEFRLRYGLAMWEWYTRSALSGIGGLRTVVVRFEEVQADPEQAVRDLAQRLDEVGLHLAGDPEAAAASLRRGRPTEGEEPLPPRYRALRNELAALPAVSKAFPGSKRSPSRRRQLVDFGPLSFPWGLSGPRRYPAAG